MLNKGFHFLPMVALVGCYSYQPIAMSAAPVGTEVRARITGAASDRVAPLIGSFDNRVLDGNVVENSSGVITLEVPTGGLPNVSETVIRLRTRVPLMPADLVALERRKLDVGRTVLLGGAVAAAVSAGVALAIRSGEDPQPGKTPTDPPPINRIPIWRFHF